MTGAGRDDILRAIDKLAAAVHSGSATRVERRREDARALVTLLVPAPAEKHRCHCGVDCSTLERLQEHEYVVHGAPVPSHWRDA